MSKLSAHHRALEYLKKHGKVSPSDLEKHVGAGKYASKFVCYLRLEGHDISAQKQGRSIVSYTYEGEGDSTTRNYKWVSPAKRKKVAAPAKKAVSVKLSKQTPIKKAVRKTKEIDAEQMLRDLNLAPEGEFGGGSYSVDPAWDSMDGIDVANFLKP